MAVRNAIYGRPGASYLDIADDIITGKVDESRVDEPARCPDPPRTQAMPEDVEQALTCSARPSGRSSSIGKGMAYSRAEDEVRKFIERTKVPFLASPMGKGVMPDSHPLSVGAARSHALQNADVVVPDGRAAQLDHALRPAAALQQGRPLSSSSTSRRRRSARTRRPRSRWSATARRSSRSSTSAREARVGLPKDTPWRTAIAEKAAGNAKQIAPQLGDDTAPRTTTAPA
jgi:2-hydroxyacyl-CoA lyase 1